MSLVRLNLDFKDPYFFLWFFLGVLHPSLVCKHVNYLGVGVCEYIDIFLGIYLNHTLFIF